MSEENNPLGDTTSSRDSVKKFLMEEYKLEEAAAAALCFEFQMRITSGARFGELTRVVARDIMMAKGK